MTEPVRIGDATKDYTAIYALCEWPSWEPRYVGKTAQFMIDRRKSHIRAALRGGQLPVNRWLRKRMASGTFAMQLLEHVPAGGDWAARERHWIAKFRADGMRLLNLTDGGEGLAGHKFSEQHRVRIAAALRTGAECSCLQCGATFWRKKNEIAKGKAKYCSRGCYAKAQIGKPKNSPAPTAAIAAAAVARAARTHCKRGHPLSGENLFITSQGSRGCKECRKLHKATYLAGLK